MVSGSRFLLRKRLGVAPDILIQMLANITLSRDLLNLGSFKLINEMARDPVARDLGAVDDLDPGKLWPSHLPDNCQQWWGTQVGGSIPYALHWLSSPGYPVGPLFSKPCGPLVFKGK